MKQQYHNKQSAVSSQQSVSLISTLGDCPRFTDVVVESGLSPNLKKDSRLSTDKGFTITELMIAVVIGMIVIGATYSTYIVQQRSFTGQDQVAELNSTSKIALNMIANNVRETGFGVPNDLSTFQRTAGCSGINGFTQKINFIPVTDDSTTAPDRITLLGGFRLVGNIAAAVSSGSTTLILTDTGILNTTDRSYITIAGLSFSIVTGISGNTLTLAPTTPVDRSYPAGLPVYLVENITYQVVFDATDNRWELQRVSRLNGGGCGTNPDTDVIAENIEDLQFAMLDIDGDGTTDRIRVNILARTARPDQNFEGQGNPPATIENRNLAATNDNFHRRWWQMQIDLRNPVNLI